jgi:hypothetical protein
VSLGVRPGPGQVRGEQHGHGPGLHLPDGGRLHPLPHRA